MRSYEGINLTPIPDLASLDAFRVIDNFLRDVEPAIRSIKVAVGSAGSGGSFVTVNSEATLPNSRILAVQAPLTKSDGGPGSAITLGAATAAPSGGYGTTALTGSAGTLLRSDARFKYPEALMTLASLATLTASDNGTDTTLTGSLGTINLRAASGFVSLDKWTGGGQGAGTAGTVLDFNARTSVLSGLSVGISAIVNVDDAANGTFFSVRVAANAASSASGLSAAAFKGLDFSLMSSVNLTGTQTVASRYYIDFAIPRLIGGTNTVVTDTGLMQSGAWPVAGVTAGAWTNVYNGKLGFPTVGGTIRRGFWITTSTGNIGTEAATVEGYYHEGLKRGLTTRRIFVGEGASNGTPTNVAIFEQATAHAVGTYPRSLKGIDSAEVAGGYIGSYATGSFIVPTEGYMVMSGTLKLTGTQRGTLQGTARLRIT